MHAVLLPWRVRLAIFGALQNVLTRVAFSDVDGLRAPYSGDYVEKRVAFPCRWMVNYGFLASATVLMALLLIAVARFRLCLSWEKALGCPIACCYFLSSRKRLT